MKVLTVCAGNFCRSPTAEHLIAKLEGYEAKSCGVFQGSVQEATQELLDWAEVIFVMEPYMKEFLQKYTDAEKIKVLNIPDKYGYGEPALVKLLAERLLPFGVDTTRVEFQPRTELKPCKAMLDGTIPLHMCGGDCGDCWLFKFGEFDYP